LQTPVQKQLRCGDRCEVFSYLGFKPEIREKSPCIYDALQLAAALIWAEEAPEALELISFDQNLRQGALKEGFIVLP
jgi:hypothetical protein